MTKLKICGLTKPCDIDFVNEGRPDYCGFIINVPQSRRSLSSDVVRSLRQRLYDSIIPVGVFVNAPPEDVAALLYDKTISIAQLHGQEDEAYLKKLKSLTDSPIIQAFSVCTKADILSASSSIADTILLDHGAGGTGTAFDWTLTASCMRSFFLAGGMTPENIPDAIKAASPYAVDISSGVETMGNKDREKILAAIAAVKTSNVE